VCGGDGKGEEIRQYKGKDKETDRETKEQKIVGNEREREK
jgi:hypothetical protein